MEHIVDSGLVHSGHSLNPDGAVKKSLASNPNARDWIPFG
jgi:hypothetical protein